MLTSKYHSLGCLQKRVHPPSFPKLILKEKVLDFFMVINAIRRLFWNLRPKVIMKLMLFLDFPEMSLSMFTLFHPFWKIIHLAYLIQSWSHLLTWGSQTTYSPSWRWSDDDHVIWATSHFYRQKKLTCAFDPTRRWKCVSKKVKN